MKNNVYPCKPQFYYIKVGFKGVKIINFKACFRDESSSQWFPTLITSPAQRNLNADNKLWLTELSIICNYVCRRDTTEKCRVNYRKIEVVPFVM